METDDVMEINAGLSRIKLYSHGDRICNHLERGEKFEPETLSLWEKTCEDNRGKIVVDVGAYTGLFSIVAARVGAKPIAFEAFPNNVARIKRNAALNQVEIDVRQLALADKQERTTFLYNPKVKGLTSGGSLEPSDNRTEGIPVFTIPLDACELVTCAAIKIDVERGEAKVLVGARRTIKRLKPLLIVEVLDAKAEVAVRDQMRELDYQRTGVRDVRNWILEPI